MEHPYGSYGFQYRGMGGLVTNIQDLWNWDRALSKGKLLSKESYAAMTTADPGGYGLGIYVRNGPDGEPILEHSGSVRGFLAGVRRYPSIDGALFILANQDTSLPLSLAETGVEQLLFDKQPNCDFPKLPRESEMAFAAGRYMDDKGRRLEIERTGSLPTLKIFWGGPVTYGYLGLDAKNVSRLYIVSSVDSATILKPDSRLKFSGEGDTANTVTLASPKSKLTFRRVQKE